MEDNLQNSKEPVSASGRWFVYTEFAMFMPFVKANEVIKYHARGLEQGDKGTWHYQGCINTWKKLTPASLCNYLGWPKTWLKHSKANDSREAAAYAKKCNSFEEDGVFVAEAGFRTDLASAVKNIKEGGVQAVALNCPEVYVKYHVGLEKLAYRLNCVAQRDYKPHVSFIWGATGVGKTRWVFDRCVNNGWRVVWLPDPTLQWFAPDVELADACIIDDMAPSDVIGAGKRALMLRLLDRYPMSVPYKGGYAPFMPKYIFITSNFMPEDFFGADPAWLRRIDYIYEVKEEVLEAR